MSLAAPGKAITESRVVFELVVTEFGANVVVVVDIASLANRS